MDVQVGKSKNHQEKFKGEKELASENRRGKIINIGNKYFMDLVRKNKYVILDVRSYSEYKERHIINAVSMPAEKLLCSNFKGNTVVVYCESGARSLECAKYLASRGVVVYNLLNGIGNL